MKFLLTYKQAEVTLAAKFIWENNKFVTRWPSKPTGPSDVEENIMSMVWEGIKENARFFSEDFELGKETNRWISYNGTGGYTVIYEYHDYDEAKGAHVLRAEILVDAAVSVDSRYTEVVFDTV